MPYRNAEAHLKSLREMCERADKIRQAAEELCAQLAARMDATRVSMETPKRKPDPGHKARKAR